MHEPTRTELVKDLPKSPFPIIDTSLDRVGADASAPIRRVDTVFIAAYATAYVGAWMALLTPVVVALALPMAHINARGGRPLAHPLSWLPSPSAPPRCALPGSVCAGRW